MFLLSLCEPEYIETSEKDMISIYPSVAAPNTFAISLIDEEGGLNLHLLTLANLERLAVRATALVLKAHGRL